MELMSTTRETYNQIAASRANFRHHSRFRNELEGLAKRWGKGKILNVGCAHGPDFVPFKDSYELYGIDYAAEMLKQAEKYAEKFQFKAELKEAEATNIPYPDGYFDWAISVAVYHHLETKEERKKAVEELYRVLKPGGEAFITVWNRWQPRHWKQRKSFLNPWRQKERTLYRYYYLFTRGEFEGLVRGAGFKIISSKPESTYRFPLKMFSRNICVVVRKG
jgi:tRNA (uracil-5-)-methyltransferase TRM9